MQDVKLVAYDLDGTLWWTTNKSPATFCTSPFSRISKDVLQDAMGIQLKLFPSAREVLEEWQRRDVLLSLISANDFPVCQEVLEKLDLFDIFTLPQIEWDDRELGTCDKKRLMIKLVKEINNAGIIEVCYPQILFIDDRIQNINRVSELNVNCVHFGVDIKRHEEIFLMEMKK